MGSGFARTTTVALPLHNESKASLDSRERALGVA
jgi:hypothetical protein